MENQEQTGKEAYEARKAEKKTVQPKRSGSSKSILRIALWVLVLVLVIVGISYLVKVSGPQSEDFSVRYESVGRDHIPEDSPYPTEYNSDPPTSGPHYPEPAVPGFYDEELPDERVVHNLEHGEIWISYKPGLNHEIVSQLRTFADPKVIITPRSANTTDVALAAWTRLDIFDVDGELNLVRIEDFIKRYQNRGPEQVPASAHYRE